MYLLNSVKQMSTSLDNHLRSILTKRLVKKKEVILKAGQISRHIYYVKSGLIQGVEWKKERETTTWIMKEGNIVFSPESFLHQVPTKESIVPLENCELWGIDCLGLENTYETYPEFERHGRIITGEYYILNKQLLSFHTGYTAFEKYKLLFETNLDLIKRLPVKVLASYLDVTKTRLSEIRAQFRKGK